MLDTHGREQAQAVQAVQDLALGKNDDVHNVAMALARSDISFRMILEVRNRLEQAYQEVMRMQV
jgi:flagellar hook-basal body complex protein FliE